jgi:isoquinoline 1-oxidoreductase beta subunit
MSGIVVLSRREMLAASLAGSAFALGMRPAVAAPATSGAAAATAVQPLISVHPDGRVEIVALLADMGQGVYTALPLILAEEMDADWAKVSIRLFDSNMATPPAGDPGMLIAASSRSVRAWYKPLRECGARARAMIVAAAAERWGAPAADCRTERGWVIHPKGKKRLSYGELAQAAASQVPPKDVVLKPEADFTLIGKVAGRRDVEDKTTGKALFASDIKLPGMLYASVTQPPFGGAALKTFDQKAAMALPRVKGLFVIDESTLVAVAEDSWSAMRALEAAAPVFEDKPDAPSSQTYVEALAQGLKAKGREWGVKGGPAGAGGGNAIDATYTLPYLAHATMEPMSCAAWFKGDSCEVWAPTQAVFAARAIAAKAAGLADEAVLVRQTFLGGGFGRRSESDFIRQAVLISKEVKGPIRLQWSRAEDMKHDYYRSAYAMRCTGAAAKGAIADYRVITAGPSILRGRMPVFSGPKAPIDPTVQNGLLPSFYNLPNSGASWVEVPSGIPISYWRSVAHSQNLFAAECFVDELAHAAGEDPLTFRQALLADDRMKAVAAKLRTLSEWDKPLPKGRARGVGLVFCYDSYCGQVVEVSVENGDVRVHKLTSVIDCGVAIQPANVVAQTEGGAIFGMSAALYGQIDVEKGVVSQSSFGDYRVLLLADTPAMTTHVMPSTAAPGGVGETGTPACAPALANALFALTGRRIRDLPLAKAFAPAS